MNITQRHELEAWLGDDHGLTDVQIDELANTVHAIAERHPDDDAEQEAALTAAYQVAVGEGDVVAEQGERLSYARRAEQKALSALQQAAVELVPDSESESGFARRAGVDRMTVRKWTGKRGETPGRRNLSSTTDVWYVLGRVYALINDALSWNGGQNLDPHAVTFYGMPTRGSWLRLYQQYASKGGGKWRDEITPLYAHSGHVWEQHNRFPDQQSETSFQTGYHHQTAALRERPPYVPIVEEM